MTWLELKQWCKDNNVPDDAVMTYAGMEEGVMELDPRIVEILDTYGSYEKRLLGITDTTPMVVEL
jgi:hypothetical protein